MMSNPASSLQHRQRLHQRQHSTPVIAFEAMKLSNMHPAMMTPQQHQQRQNLHRRGQSFDQQQRSPIRRHQRPGSTVSIANLGSTPHGQQILREAQQQKLARPGQQSMQFHHQQQMQQHIDMQLSPQCGIFPSNTSPLASNPYDDLTMNAIMQNASGMQIAHSQYFNFPVQSAANYNGLPLVDENNHQLFQDGGLIDQSFSYNQSREPQMDLRIQTQFRPHTPTAQIQTAQFPLTPPFTANVQHVQCTRSLQSSPAIQSPFPVPMQRGRSLQGIIEHEEPLHIPSQDIQHKIDQRFNFESADMPVPDHFATGPSPCKSFQDDDEPIKDDNSMLFFDETGGEIPNLKDRPAPILISSGMDGSQSPSRPALSPRRLSISDLNLDPGIHASIEETNVTLDDIAQYIEGPDPVDNKWVCKFDDCNKKFGRKENIKSHVQTHLGDRQFRCDHCRKCFVRGHDLKRHAKIHTGNKPYPCLCGNAFARHDALTRHRQRGMCIGAFEGVVKKAMKRGRPRKHRPEMDERMDKSSKTRAKNGDHSDQYASSSSCYTGSSWGSPPTDTLESLSNRGHSPFDDMGLFGSSQTHPLLDGAAFAAEMFSFTPPASPGFSTGNKPSPVCNVPTLSDLIDGEDMTESSHELPHLDSNSLMANPMMLQHSQHSLPSLSHSGSSPAADMIGFDFSDLSSSMIRETPLKLDMERNDFDNFLDYGGMEMGLESMGSDSFFNNL